MVCPNKNSEEWKAFVKRVGTELQALGEYYNNGYSIPTTDKAVTFDNKNEIAAYAKFVKFSDKLKFAQTKTIADLEFVNSEVVENVRNAAIDVVGQINNEHNLLIDLAGTMIDNAQSVISSLSSEAEMTAKELHSQKKNLGVFDQLSDIRSLILASTQLTPKEKKSLKMRLNNAQSDLEDFNIKRKRTGKNFLIKELASKSSLVTDTARSKYESQYRKEKPFLDSNMKKEEYEEKLKSFVDEMINANSESLQIETEGVIRELMETAPQDIGTIASWIDDPRGTNDHMVQLIVEYFDNADFKTTADFTKARSTMISAHDEFMKGRVNETDQRKKYEGIIEKMQDDTGKLTETQHMVGEHYSYVREDFYRTKAELLSQDLTREQKDNVALEYLMKYSNDKDVKVVEGLSAKLAIAMSNQGLALLSPKNTKAKHFNPQYKELQKDPRKLKLYQALVNFNKVSDKTSKMKNLNLKFPSITKHGAENLSEKGVKEYLAGEYRDKLKRKIDDADSNVEVIDGIVKVRTDSAGNLMKEIKSAYRGQLAVADQSFDLVGMAIANRHAVLDFKHKSDIQYKVEIAHEIMGDREVKKTANGKPLTAVTRKIQSVFGKDAEDEMRDVEGKGVDSNVYKLITHVLEDRLYGQGSKSLGEIMGLSADKVAGTLATMAGHTMLMANMYGATSNVLQGKVMNYLESVKGDVFNRKQLLTAESKYWKMLTEGGLNDIGSSQDKSVVNLMLERFIEGSSGFTALNDKLVKGSKARRLFSVSTLHGLNSSAEHYIQSTALLAMMENTIVDGKPISDHYKVVDGTLTLPKEIKFNEEQFARKVKMTIADLHGNYSANNKAIVQRYWYGKLAMFLRKWIVRSVKRRWVGVENATTSMDDLLSNVHKLNHRQNMGFSEGTYTSLIRYVAGVTGAVKTLQAGTLRESWHQLSTMERKNIQLAVNEIGLMVGTLLASLVLADMAEDDDDESSATWKAAYFMRRIYSESAFYVPVLGTKDTLRILSTPAATTNYLEKISDGIGFFADDLGSILIGDDVKRRRDGDIKSVHKVKKLIPILTMVNGASAEDKYGFISGENSK